MFAAAVALFAEQAATASNTLSNRKNADDDDLGCLACKVLSVSADYVSLWAAGCRCTNAE
jgi:hypothetical protein